MNERSAVIKSMLICFLAITAFLHSGAQSKAIIIAAIRKDFQAINTDETLAKKTLSDEEFTENVPDGGCELTGYYKKDSIVKIVEWIGLSYGNRTREFYFKKGRLFFVYERFESFVIKDSTEGEIDHSQVTTTFEGRYYFNMDKLIGQKVSGRRTFEEGSVAVIKELLNGAKENTRLLK